MRRSSVTPEEMHRACEQACEIVSRWPKWKQTLLGGKPYEDHISPNGAKPGTFVHRAEKWYLDLGMTIPRKEGMPHSFQGMLDDYTESISRDSK